MAHGWRMAMKSRSVTELAEVEGHVIAGEQHIVKQREIIRRLEHAGRGNSETAKVARDLLHSMELAQRAHIAHRDQLRALVKPFEKAHSTARNTQPTSTTQGTR
jgi:predicted  nucleic acid-binding Zn-ribbon protein